MSPRPLLFATSAIAAIFFTVASWAFIFATIKALGVAPRYTTAAVGIAVIVPDFLATGWIFRKLQLNHSRNDARRGATAFAVCAPVALAISYPLAVLVGSYAERLLGSRFILPTVIVFVFSVMAIAPGAAVVWALHPSGGAMATIEGDQK